MPFRCLYRVAALLLLALPWVGAQAVDADADGLADALEQQLLERFQPRLFVGRDDCDVAPSRLQPGSMEPIAEAQDGTLYGQAFPLPPAANGSARMELHYYHLWRRDCGRLSHNLDAERVSVLLEAPPAEGQPDAAHAAHWKAVYWYAAAHEDTVCDVSHGAHAKALNATERGARVWVSLHKHASYLAGERCKFGCGGDTCKNIREVSIPRILNLGEPGRPLNGALWIASPQWPLEAKMRRDFDDATLAQFAAGNPKKLFAVNQGVPPVRATILAGNETLDGMATGSQHTGNALGTGKKATTNALGKAFRATGRFLGGEPKQKQAKTEAPASADSPVRQ